MSLTAAVTTSTLTLSLTPTRWLHPLQSPWPLIAAPQLDPNLRGDPARRVRPPARLPSLRSPATPQPHGASLSPRRRLRSARLAADRVARHSSALRDRVRAARWVGFLLGLLCVMVLMVLTRIALTCTTTRVTTITTTIATTNRTTTLGSSSNNNSSSKHHSTIASTSTALTLTPTGPHALPLRKFTRLPLWTSLLAPAARVAAPMWGRFAVLTRRATPPCLVCCRCRHVPMTMRRGPGQQQGKARKV